MGAARFLEKAAAVRRNSRTSRSNTPARLVCSPSHSPLRLPRLTPLPAFRVFTLFLPAGHRKLRNYKVSPPTSRKKKTSFLPFPTRLLGRKTTKTTTAGVGLFLAFSPQFLSWPRNGKKGGGSGREGERSAFASERELKKGKLSAPWFFISLVSFTRSHFLSSSFSFLSLSLPLFCTTKTEGWRDKKSLVFSMTQAF